MICWLIGFVLQNIVENKLFSISTIRYLCSFGKQGETNLIIVTLLYFKLRFDTVWYPDWCLYNIMTVINWLLSCNYRTGVLPRPSLIAFEPEKQTTQLENYFQRHHYAVQHHPSFSYYHIYIFLWSSGKGQAR